MAWNLTMNPGQNSRQTLHILGLQEQAKILAVFF